MLGFFYGLERPSGRSFSHTEPYGFGFDTHTTYYINVLVKNCGLTPKNASNCTDNVQISTKTLPPGGKVAERSEVGRGTAKSESMENACNTEII